MHRDQLYWTKRGDWCISGEFAIWNCQRPLQGRGGGAARGWSHQRAVKGPRFHVNVRAYYYEFRNNGTRACKLRLALFFLFLCVCLSSAHGGAEELNKPRLPRNDQPEEETGGTGARAFLPCRDILYLDAYSTKGKKAFVVCSFFAKTNFLPPEGVGRFMEVCVGFESPFDRKFYERER